MSDRLVVRAHEVVTREDWQRANIDLLGYTLTRLVTEVVAEADRLFTPHPADLFEVTLSLRQNPFGGTDDDDDGPTAGTTEG